MAEIPSVTLNNGIEMPQFGLGMYLIPSDHAVDVMTIAFENGYRLIDTAAAYNNEEGIGEGIRHSEFPRNELFVTTKLWNTDQGYDNTLKAFEISRKKLRLDYIDLYLIHWPYPKKGLMVETWKAFEKLYKDGYVRAIGVCNFTIDQLNHLIQEAEIVPSVLQVEIHPTFIQTDLRQYAKKQGIHVESWHPLGGRKNKEELLNLPLFKTLAAKYHKTPAQIVLRWHIQLGLIVIPKSANPDRIKENCNIFDFELSQKEIESLSALDKGIRLGPDPNTFTGETSIS